ncbi:hypothetical protein M0813_16584 [Anaeramoeba flamelloides]|uniref:Uncharacterized protein n=1 Tax=Anaeramoeba flamelloides TaxID=1746091 RepID=A0ABQ8YZ42_9EUKA|nr:hypothetical protein M0813_16584 [Anaeramoeba flamelloides]
MNDISQELKQNPNLPNIIEDFKNLKTYSTRLETLIKIRPESIIGLTQSSFQKKQAGKENQDQENKIPDLVQIKKDSISDLSFLTNRSERTISRGMNSFLKTKFNLTKTRKVDPVWIYFVKHTAPTNVRSRKLQTIPKADTATKIQSQKKIENGNGNKKIYKNTNKNIRSEKETKNSNLRNQSFVKLRFEKKKLILRKRRPLLKRTKSELNLKKSTLSKNDNSEQKSLIFKKTLSDHSLPKKRRLLKSKFIKSTQSHSSLEKEVNLKKTKGTRKKSKAPFSSKSKKSKKKAQNQRKKNHKSNPKHQKKTLTSGNNISEDNWGYGRIFIDLCPNEMISPDSWISEIERKYGQEY